MPPWILAAIPVAVTALVTACAIALVAGPLVIPLWSAHMDELTRKRIVAAVKGANDALGPFIKASPTDVDDRVLAVSEMVVRELGRVGAKNQEKVKAVAAGIVSKSVSR